LTITISELDYRLYLRGIKEKAALWDMFCLLKQPDFQWLFPFLWDEKTNKVSDLALSIAKMQECTGKRAALNEFISEKWLILSEILSKSRESGGHPASERMLLVLLKLLNGEAYERVLEDIREIEISSILERNRFASHLERRNAEARARQRVRRAKRLLSQKGISVKHLTIQEKYFDKLFDILER
jgi:hypothetical protein